MIVKSFLKAIEQITDKRFKKVFILGVGLGLLVFTGLFSALLYITPEQIQFSDWDWVNDMLSWILGWSSAPIIFITIYLFFPAISTMFMGLFLDDVVDAVEDKHFRNAKASRKVSGYESFMMALKMGLWVIFLNILALPLYFILIFTAIGPFILFLILNGYLLGRDYFNLVAARHFLPEDAERVRKSKGDKVFLTGGVITLLYIVPFVNLAAPIIGSAMMVHIFHDALDKEG
jgi:CysZ protein